jgi:Leucine-rich repeat (LRR) protein
VATSIDISNNLIFKIQRGLIEKQTGISSFRASNNKLTSIPGDLFAFKTSLVEIYLDGNQLTGIPVEMFKGLNGSLEFINLNQNRIRYFKNELFDGLLSLKTLIVSNNWGTIYANGVFAGLRNIEYLNMRFWLIWNVPHLPGI